MAGTTDTQSLRFGQVTDVITHTMVANLADDIAAQLDAADAAQLTVLKRPVVFVRRLANQATAAGVQAPVTFDDKPTDTHLMVDLATQPTRITVNSSAGAGMYMFHARLTAETGVGTWTAGHLSFYKNAVQISQRSAFAQRNATTLTAQVQMNVTDFMQVRFQHDGTGTPNITFVECWVHKLNS